MNPALSFRMMNPTLLSASANNGLKVGISPLNRQTPLHCYPVNVSLQTEPPRELATLLGNAGLFHNRGSPAEELAIHCFKVGRRFGRQSPYKHISFDWDHTLSNFRIFEGLGGLLPVKMNRKGPGRFDSTRMSALEAPRPFMLEFVFGTMVGFALEQGLEQFNDWNSYRPQVGIATHTWPDRLANLAQHYLPLLSLMEGMAPGHPSIGDKIRSGQARAFVHLGDFLEYANNLLTKYETVGMEGLIPAERYELLQYMKDGKAHYRKPLTAMAEHGWETSSLLHFDDQTRIIEDIRADGIYQGAAAVFTPNPHMPRGKNITETQKVLVGDLLLEMLSGSRLKRARKSKIASAAQQLIRSELSNSFISELLFIMEAEDPMAVIRKLQKMSFTEKVHTPASNAALLPNGTNYTLYDTSTTLGSFWEGYVQPAQFTTARIRQIRKAMGGYKKIRADYLATQ